DTLASAGGTSTTLLLDQFDAALGTLTGVEVTIGNPSMRTLTGEYQSVGAPGSIDATLTTSISGLPLTSVTPFDLRLLSSCSSCPGSGTAAVPITVTYTYDQWIGAPFVGNGTVHLTLENIVTGS